MGGKSSIYLQLVVLTIMVMSVSAIGKEYELFMRYLKALHGGRGCR